MSDISGKCDLKCDYNFQYQNSNCVATNRGDYISIAYDSSSNPPVTYNTVGYNVSEVRIYAPSIHTFNDSNAVAEMIVIHNSNKGTSPLLVCVPFTKDNSNTKSSSIMASIIDAVATNAPSDSESTSVTINDFTLNSFVPRQPYFTYSAIQPYQPCIGDVDLIVFSPQASNCYISANTLKKLSSIISENPYKVKTGPQLFYNEKGPGVNGLTSDDIYIDCQPVGVSSEEKMVVVSSSDNGTFSWNDFINNSIFQIIMGALLFIIIIFVFNYIIKLFGKPSGLGRIPIPSFTGK